MRTISLAMMSVASSQEMRSYLLFPRFCGLRSPSGSQSTLLSGYRIRLGEYVRFLYAVMYGAGRDLRPGSRTAPLRSIFHGRKLAPSYFQS